MQPERVMQKRRNLFDALFVHFVYGTKEELPQRKSGKKIFDQREEPERNVDFGFK